MKMDKVLRLVEGVPNRKAKFRTVIALYWQRQSFFRGVVSKALLSMEKEGIGGFGYDPMYLCRKGMKKHLQN